MPVDWDKVASTPVDDPGWEDPSELGLLSFRDFIREHSTESPGTSSGYLRLTGPGIVGSSGSVEGIALTLLHFQRLVLASAMSIEGRKGLRGPAPALIEEKAKLNIVASPVPGSLILEFSPAMDPDTEFTRDHQPALFDDSDHRVQLIDLAMESAISLMESAKYTQEAETADEFLHEVADRGPRVASALKDLTSNLQTVQMAPTLMWERVNGDRRRVTLSSSDLVKISGAIVDRSLEQEEIVLVGIVRTVSDISAWELELTSGNRVRINASKIAEQDISRIHVGMAISVRTAATQHISPTSEERINYQAISFEIPTDPLSALRNVTP